MKLVTTAQGLFKKTTLFATALVLAVSSLTAAVPFIFSQVASAAEGYNLTATPFCENGLVSFDVKGTNPNSGQPAVWVKSSANFALSEPVLAQPGTANIPVPLKTGVASIPASEVTIYVSPTKEGQYTLLNDQTAVASYGAFNCYDTVYVAQNGSDANFGTTVASPFATIQKALDTVNENGIVYVADGIYNGTAVIAKNGTKLIGSSGNRDAVEIHVVNNAGGQGGIWAEGKSNIAISNLAVVGTASFTNGGLIKISNGANATISNVVVKSGDIVNSNVPRTNTSGINVNGYANVNIDNVFVAGLAKDGISFVGQQNGSVVTKNVALNNIAVSGSGWSDLAFYTKDASITGVTLNDVRLQYGDRGLYIDGANSAGVKNQNTVSGVNGGMLQLNNTLIKNINNEYVNNEQAADVNASGIFIDSMNRPVYEDAVAVKDLTPTELANVRTNFIKDKTNKTGGVVGYGTVFIQGPAAPTNLSPNGWTSPFVKFSWNASADGAKYNLHYSRVHPNEVANAPIITTPNATPELTVELADGPLFWQVQAIDAAGNAGVWSEMGYATIDTTAPVLAPSLIGGTVNGVKTITLNITESYLKASAIRILDSNGNSVSATPGYSDQTGSQNPISYIWDTKLVQDGNYKIQYSARDIVGQSTTKFYGVTVDNTAPIVEILTVSGLTSGTPTISGTAEEGSSLSATFGGQPAELLRDGNAWTFTSPVTLSNGAYPFTITATDILGNQRTYTTSALVAVTPVVVSPVQPVTTPSAPTNNGAGPVANPASVNTGTVLLPAITSPATVLGTDTSAQNTEGAAEVEGASTQNNVAQAANSEANQGTFLGMSWYWWLLIIAGLALVGWVIAGAVRKRQAE